MAGLENENNDFTNTNNGQTKTKKYVAGGREREG